MEEMLQLLKGEMGYLPENNEMQVFLDNCEPLHLKRNDIIIEAGVLNSNVYIVKEGIIRFSDMNGDKERTFAFALPGTMFMSKHSFFKGLPSYYQVTACCDTTVLYTSKQTYYNIINTHHKLALWMLNYAYGELFFQEYKNANIQNGNAKERFKSILGDRPQLIRDVPQKILASYLGITPEYFSHLKREYLTGKF